MKFLKWTSIVLVSLVVILFVSVKIASKSLPEGEQGPEAEALADKMLAAINKTAYDDLSYLEWTFRDDHHFSWNKTDHTVIVRWDHYEVNLSPNDLTGTGKKGEFELTGESLDEAVKKAWSLFANDSFWLVAPYKIRDPGTMRRLIQTEEGPALLVTYTSGGVTPGDSYLWYLDDEGRPVAWEMWTSIIALKGMRFTWENWSNHNGAWFAPDHQGPGPVAVPITIHRIE